MKAIKTKRPCNKILQWQTKMNLLQKNDIKPAKAGFFVCSDPIFFASICLSCIQTVQPQRKLK